jgi:hypothetical protein
MLMLNFFDGFLEFAAGHQLAAITAQAFDANICSHAIDFPAEASAGMSFAQDNNIANVYIQHKMTSRLCGRPATRHRLQ